MSQKTKADFFDICVLVRNYAIIVSCLLLPVRRLISMITSI